MVRWLISAVSWHRNTRNVGEVGVDGLLILGLSPHSPHRAAGCSEAGRGRYAYQGSH